MTQATFAEQIKAKTEESRLYEELLPRVSLQHGEKTVMFRVSSRVAALRVFSINSKEPETLAWIEEMDQNTILFDVGANIGLYTIWAAVTRGARVHAFEPEASSYAMLCGNVFDNGVADRVRAYCLGLSDKAGIGHMLLSSTSAATSGHQVMVANAATGIPHSHQYPQGVVTQTLDALVFDLGLPCPSDIKIDVDGLEHAIIAGAGRVLAHPDLRSILIEVEIKNPLHQNFMARLTDLGFEKDAELEARVEAKTEGGNAFIGNIVFRRK
ncbi:MAG: FkbM family methyltransferase [Alphaproteobacteria bacterium]|nr:FkbM family methyltransferase [Alphaproteobacteria bacterium]